MAKALMIQGTGSGAGKSLIAAALCRIFSDRAVRVAPFKSQNMALNSYITLEGGEIGRAQALQADAARVEPLNDMNPILLKASGEKGSQVVVHGRVYKTMKAREYYDFKKQAWEAVKESYDRLSKDNDLIVIEGAGSPAEINLSDVEIVNMAVAKYAGAPVILVGDIDKGGVFASLFGTVKLVGRDSKFVKGFLINKFRGDRSILDPGLHMLKEKTGKPVIGVLPYIADIGLPEEDGMSLHKGMAAGMGKTEYEKIKIVVLRLQFISNFTDFDPFHHEPDVELIYSRNATEIENADAVIIPGSKNTVKDLHLLREHHLDRSIRRAYEKGIHITGICGGYQMLGQRLFDPLGIEGPHDEIDGLGLLDIETTFNTTKTTCRVEAEITGNGDQDSASRLRGYEIHMGESVGNIGLFKVCRLSGVNSLEDRDRFVMDGSANGTCWGTYIHGIFENDPFRRDFINTVRERKGLSPIRSGVSYAALKDEAIDRLARVVHDNIDMDFIERLIKL